MTLRQWLRYRAMQVACFIGLVVSGTIGRGFDEAAGGHTAEGFFCAILGLICLGGIFLAEKAMQLAQRRADLEWSVRS